MIQNNFKYVIISFNIFFKDKNAFLGFLCLKRIKYIITDCLLTPLCNIFEKCMK